MLSLASSCPTPQDRTPADDCVEQLVSTPSNRAERLLDRLRWATDTTRGARKDGHELIDVTMGRLHAARCLVPQTLGGRSDCGS
jgi:hypothetical protein